MQGGSCDLLSWSVFSRVPGETCHEMDGDRTRHSYLDNRRIDEAKSSVCALTDYASKCLFPLGFNAASFAGFNFRESRQTTNSQTIPAQMIADVMPLIVPLVTSSQNANIELRGEGLRGRDVKSKSRDSLRTSMFQEYDVVELVESLSDSLKSGTRGAVVMVYPGDPAEYEVEFVGLDGRTIEVRTVSEDKIRISTSRTQ